MTTTHTRSTTKTTAPPTSPTGSYASGGSSSSSSRPHHDLVDLVLNSLSPSELEMAAQTSYAYTRATAATATTTMQGGSSCDSNQQDEEHQELHKHHLFRSSRSKSTLSSDRENHRKLQRLHASTMALRYLEHADWNTAKALQKIRSTLAFREQYQIANLRRTFEQPESNGVDDSGATDASSRYRLPLYKFLSHKQLYVQGHDREGHSTLIFVPRLVVDHDPVWTIPAHLFTLEKAIACSKAPDRTINAVVDCQGFSPTRNTPPHALARDMMTALRQHYIGHVHQIYFVDAPTTMVLLWGLFKHVAGRRTREKIHFVNSVQDKQRVFGSHRYSPDQVASWMLPSSSSSTSNSGSGGDSKNRPPLDIDKYLYETPFDRAYGEMNNENDLYA